MAAVLPDVLENLISVRASASPLRLVMDSRKVSDDCIFVALPGTRFDGRIHIKEAAARGARYILAEAEGMPESMPDDLGERLVLVSGLRQWLGEFAHRFYCQPSCNVTVIAVTGTNGKTTITQTLAKAFARQGLPASVVGTLGHGVPGDLSPLDNTTPDAPGLHGILEAHCQAGMRVVAIEASSHGLDQGRLDGVRIDTAIFSNITRDHLDYHGTMEAYAAAKARLAAWPGLRTLVLNADDPLVDAMSAHVGEGVRVIRYSLDPVSHADVRLLESRYSGRGVSFRCTLGDTAHAECRTTMMGAFNLSNLLAVVATLWSQGISPDDIGSALEDMAAVSGRMQPVCVEGVVGPAVLVDYAHTPDALEQVLKAARHHCHGEVWCVFGCGGNRDRGKRPLMAAIAEREADQVIVTTDNPRDELAADIIRDILGGFSSKQPLVLEDRAEAISRAIRDAGDQDLVMIAGKGHETWQEIAGVRNHFSDVEQAARALRARSHGVTA